MSDIIEVIEPSVEIYPDKYGTDILRAIEFAGRTCYKSEERITEDSAEKFVRAILKRGHLSVIEHEKLTARVICDRGVTHEIVRHRIASYSQESTRYVNYSGQKMKFIKPCFWEEDDDKYIEWFKFMERCAITYNGLIVMGATPQEARSVLPNSLKTEIVITYNLREWRHFFSMRCAKAAHPQMRQVADMLLEQISEEVPVIFEDQVKEFLS